MGRYRILDTIGHGGVGAVYRAEDVETDSVIALKVISANLLQTDEEQRTFSRAIRAARKLHHRNIVRILDEGNAEGRRFLTMELLDGLTLRKIIELRHDKAQAFTPEELVPIFNQVGAALDAAHKSTWHGDLKPENIIVLPDVLKVTDFNLLKALPLKPFLGIAKSRSTGYPYIAPELRIESSHIDGRVDVYSLGVILCEMLTGFVYEGHYTRALTAALEKLPSRLESVIRKCLGEHPDTRFKRAGAMAKELAAALGEIEASRLPVPIGAARGQVAEKARVQHAQNAKPPPPPMKTDMGSLPAMDSPVATADGPSEIGASQVVLLGDSGATATAPPVATDDSQEDDAIQTRLDGSADRTAEGRRRSEPATEDASDELSTGEETPDARGPRLWSDPKLELESGTGPAELAPPPLPDGLDGPSDTFSLSELDRVGGGDAPESRPKRAPIHEQNTSISPHPRPDLVEVADDLSSEEDTSEAVTQLGAFDESSADSEPAALADVSRSGRVPLQPVVPPVRRRSPNYAAAVGVFVLVSLVGLGVLWAMNRNAAPTTPDAGVAVSTVDAGNTLVAAVPDAGPAKPDAGMAQRGKPDAGRKAKPGKKPTKVDPDDQVRKAMEARERAEAAAREKAAREKAEREKAEREKAGREKAQVASVSDEDLTCPRGMRKIKGTTFTMGSAPNDSMRGFGEKSPTRVTVKTYCMDYFEYPNGKSALPSVGVTWTRAKALCAQRQKRLCTEAEWEYACKGGSNRRFPYGNTWDPDRCNTEDAQGKPRPLATAKDFKKCRSPLTIFQLSGNAEEWVADTYSSSGAVRTVKGGAANRPDTAARCAARRAQRARTSSPMLGFRCCADPK